MLGNNKYMSNTVTLALMCTSLNNMAGGLERQIIRTAAALANCGFKVYIISFDSRKDESFYQIPPNVIWLKCGFGLTPHQAASKRKRIQQLFELRKNLTSIQCKCLITFHHGLYLRSFIATFMKNIINIVSERNSLTFYNYVSVSKLNPAFLLSFLAKRRTIQCAGYIDEYPRIFHSRIRVIPNILVSPQPLSIPQLKLKTHRVAFLGRLEAQKNITPLLEQMISTEKEINFSLHIAGSGSRKPIIESRYKSLIEKKKLFLYDNIENIYYFLSESSLFFFPSLWEGYPNALVEAISIGLPVVTTHRLSKLHEFVEHQKNAIITNDNDFYQEISNLICDYKKLNSFSKQSLLKYQKISSKAPVNQWLELLSELNINP